MKYVNSVKILKIAFWIGAITDGLAAIIMILPTLRFYIFSSDNVDITPAYRYSLGMGAALMLGWTVLLFWGSIKPVERRGLLLITVFPVITGIVMAQVYAVYSGLVEISGMIPVWIHLVFLSSLFLFAYFSSSTLNKK